MSEYNEDDRKSEDGHFLQLSSLRSDQEPQEGDHLLLPELSESEVESSIQLSELSDDNDPEPQEGDIFVSREAAIDQLRRWAQHSGFKLMIGHTKKGSEMKGMSDTFRVLAQLSVLSFSNLGFISDSSFGLQWPKTAEKRAVLFQTT